MKLPGRHGLDGDWNVVRVSGLVPPLYGVRKQIDGDHGWTRVGPFPGVPFSVHGRELRYRSPFGGFVDVLEHAGDGYLGHATFHGRELGRFRLVRR